MFGVKLSTQCSCFYSLWKILIEFHIKRMLPFIRGVEHFVNWVFRIFQSFSRYSNKSHKVMRFLQNAISPIKNKAGTLRRQLLTEHSRHFLLILLWIYHKYKLWACQIFLYIWIIIIYVQMKSSCSVVLKFSNLAVAQKEIQMLVFAFDYR